MWAHFISCLRSEQSAAPMMEFTSTTALFNRLVIGVLCLIIMIFVYMWLFIFIHSALESKKFRQKMRMRLSSFQGISQLLRTIFSWGFLKVSARRFLRFHINCWRQRATAQLGRMAPDVPICTSKGELKSLLKDYIQRLPANCPLVLNFGSYT